MLCGQASSAHEARRLSPSSPHQDAGLDRHTSRLSFEIEPLTPPVAAGDLKALAELLVDAVDSGAAVSFLAPVDLRDAEEWWRSTIVSAHNKAVFLVARSDGRVIGTVQLQPAWAPNQPHRAEVVKLLVHGKFRRSGLGAALTRRVEDAAREAGFTLLTLDAKKGGPAEQLYLKLGWIHAGTIPDYALDTDGKAFHDAVFFFKKLE